MSEDNHLAHTGPISPEDLHLGVIITRLDHMEKGQTEFFNRIEKELDELRDKIASKAEVETLRREIDDYKQRTDKRLDEGDKELRALREEVITTRPVKRVVYGAVGLILTGILVALIALVVKQ